MHSVYKLLPHYTYEDYCRWEGQWELIDGIPYAMSPMPRPEHQAVSINLASEFRRALKKCGNNCKIYQPIDYKISDDTILNPDLLIVCDPITKQFLDFAPDLVVEILSPATALKDRHTKFDIYQKEKIPYYLIVDIDTKTVEVYTLEDDNYKLQSTEPNKAFSFSIAGCSLPIVFENIWS